MSGNQERTFIMVKPDAVQRGLVGKIIERFEQKGFKLVAMKFMWVSKRAGGGSRKEPRLRLRLSNLFFIPSPVHCRPPRSCCSSTTPT